MEENILSKILKKKKGSSLSENETVEDLMERHRTLTGIISWEKHGTGKPSETSMKKLGAIEEKIIQFMPDRFLKDFLTIYCSKDFDITEIVEAKNDGDWEKPVREVVRRLAFLADGERLGYPYTGQQMLSWLMTLAGEKSDNDKKTSIERISEGITKSKKEGMFCGKSLTSWGMKEIDVDQVFNFSLIPLMMSKDNLKHFGLLAEVASDVEGGQVWVQKIIQDSAK